MLKASLFLLVMIIVGRSSSQFTFGTTLQKFRQDYVYYKCEAIKNIDVAFFRVYSELNSTLFRVMNPFVKLNDTFNKACKSFPMSTIKNSTASRLKNACKVINSVISLAYPTVNSCLITFYSGLLGGVTTPPKQIADEIFYLVEDQMNTIPTLYETNPRCVTLFLKNHTTTYKTAIDSILAMNRKATDNMFNLFYNATKASDSAYNTITTMTNALNSCAKNSKPTECVKSWVRE